MVVTPSSFMSSPENERSSFFRRMKTTQTQTSLRSMSSENTRNRHYNHHNPPLPAFFLLDRTLTEVLYVFLLAETTKLNNHGHGLVLVFLVRHRKQAPQTTVLFLLCLVRATVTNHHQEPLLLLFSPQGKGGTISQKEHTISPDLTAKLLVSQDFVLFRKIWCSFAGFWCETGSFQLVS